MSNKKPVDKAEVLLALEKIKKYRTPDPLKSAIVFGIVLGLFMTLMFGFRQSVHSRIDNQTWVIRSGQPFGYIEWSETTCPGHIFKVCERSEKRFLPINFLIDFLLSGGVSFLIAYIMLVWNIQGPPWRYYSRFDFEK